MCVQIIDTIKLLILSDNNYIIIARCISVSNFIVLELTR